MSLITALNINASGLSAQRQRFEVASSNLVNTESTRTEEGGAYRRQDIVFQTADFGDSMVAASGGASGVEVADILKDTGPFDRRYIPGHPDADPDGYVDFPNINPAEQMVSLMAAARSYEANIAAITIVKSMIAKTLEIGR